MKSSNSLLKKMFLINSKHYELLGVVLVALSGSFLYNVITKKGGIYVYELFLIKIPDVLYDSMFGALYMFSGTFFLYYSFVLFGIEKDYASSNLFLKYSAEEWKFRRISYFLKVSYIVVIVALILSVFIPFVSTMNGINRNSSIDIYDNKGADLQNKYSTYNHYYEKQLEIISYIIENRLSNINNINVLDIASGSGMFLSLLKDKYPDVHVLGSDGDINVIEYSKNILQSKSYDKLIIDEPVLWKELSKNAIIKNRKWDIVCLLGNSLPSINKRKDITKIFLEVNSILDNQGIFVIDFRNLTPLLNKSVTKKVVGTDYSSNYSLHEEIINTQQDYLLQKIYESNGKGILSDHTNSWLKYCLYRTNIIDHLDIADFDIIKDDTIEKIYNLKELEIIIAIKR